ncbi:MAG TPA: iron-only hydrogenase system regulator [Deltaproteobacteria bacterium]|nr:iron-only hydrogenase system regulator [Deltaproteobacteria bacterium]
MTERTSMVDLSRIGVVSIFIHDRLAQSSRVNEILSAHGEIVVGRMGIPYREAGVHVIALIIHGTTDEIGALTGKLGSIRGVEVKSALARN